MNLLTAKLSVACKLHTFPSILQQCEPAQGLPVSLLRPPKPDLLGCAGVGSINNTFGCPGVEEHTQFFKSVDDARKFRRQVLQCFERAALPETTPEVTHKSAAVPHVAALSS